MGYVKGQLNDYFCKHLGSMIPRFDTQRIILEAFKILEKINPMWIVETEDIALKVNDSQQNIKFQLKDTLWSFQMQNKKIILWIKT